MRPVLILSKLLEKKNRKKKEGKSGSNFMVRGLP
jgi:hypothetical protein